MGDVSGRRGEIGEGATLDYAAARVPVRADLRRDQAQIVEALVRPGPHLSGAERRAIAAESRLAPECPLCRARSQSLSPEQPRGRHRRTTALREPLLEMAHRIRADPQRLGRSWFGRMLEAGLTEGEYVEAVGVVSFTAGIDSFCLALGIPPFGLPEPRAGEPTRSVPAGLRGGSAWVSMLAPEDASGPEADLYGDAAFVPNIARALSRVPEHARLLQTTMGSHYVPLGKLRDPSVGRALGRPQIELVAARVSALNECFY